MKTKPAIIIVVILAMLIAANFLSPFVFLRSLSEAARRGDRDVIAFDVDFPAVRDNLKSQLGEYLARKAVSESSRKRNPFTKFAMQLLPAVGNQVIDAVVTPDGIATILRRHVQQSGDSPIRPSLWRGEFSWLDLDHVRGMYANTRHPGEVFAITLERRGIFGWQVVGIRLPLDQLL
jgi:hypothetical protein